MEDSRDALILTPLDGAVPALPLLGPEVEASREIAADASRPVPERLETYAGIVDSEVGDTTMDRARNVIDVASGWAAEVSDQAMLATSRDLKENEGLSVLTASTAGLAALLERHDVEPLPSDRYVVISGRRA